jgi:gentisate 1,2-dioxygenase
VLPTIRAEMHRIQSGASTVKRQEVGSSVFQVFEGSGKVKVGEREWSVKRGDMFVVPSWAPFSAQCDPGHACLDLFRFSDSPIFEALNAHRTTTIDGA